MRYVASAMGTEGNWISGKSITYSFVQWSLVEGKGIE